MIVWHFMGNALHERRGLLIFSAILVAMFQVLILTLVVGARLLDIVEQFYQQLPPQVQLLFGEQFIAQFSVNGVVAFGYNHPLVIVMLSIVAISVPARHVAGEVENGTLELLFALPVTRLRVALAQWLFVGLALLGLVAACGVGTACGLWLYPEVRGVPFDRIVMIGLNLWMLMFAIGSYTLLISSYGREGGKAAMRSAGLTWVFYFVNVLVVMWPTVGFLEPFTVFHYHRPAQIMLDASDWGRDMLVLLGLALATGTLAIRQIGRRDVPG